MLFILLGIYYPELHLWDKTIAGLIGKASLVEGKNLPLTFIFLNWWGTKKGMFATCTLGVASLFLFYRRIREGLLLAGGMLGGWVFLEVTKALFHRRRPEGLYLFPAPGYSFPSGHAFVTFLFTTFFISLSLPLIYRQGRNSGHGWLKILLFSSYIILTALTLATGWSRIYFGMHYPTDVLGGWLAGVFWAGLYNKIQAWYIRHTQR
ncbi:MAG: phosphatase PAP2 family protein [Thermanaeromonas sp.]|nr:phosphatase PAP2 family protein [Thermanaeromonas sp.]